MDCIDLFKRAAVALQTDNRYLVLDQARKANDKDEELQNLIGEFNLARMDADDDRQMRYADEDELADAGYGEVDDEEVDVRRELLLCEDLRVAHDFLWMIRQGHHHHLHSPGWPASRQGGAHA